MNRREALLGVLLVPFVKPLAKLLPEKDVGLSYTGLQGMVDDYEPIRYGERLYWSELQDRACWDYTGEKVHCFYEGDKWD